MTSTTETGHHKNLANFEEMITVCAAFGAAYNPSNPKLTLSEMDVLKSNALDSLQLVKDTKAIFDNESDLREIIFTPFKKLSTRIVNSIASMGVATQTIDDIKTINFKIQGKRAKTPDAETPTPTDPASPAESNEIKKISVAQLSYDSNIENFGKIIARLNTETKYQPNETELQINGLNTLLAEMKTINTKTVTTANAYKIALIKRNEILYTTVTGLTDTAQKVKKYILSVYGTTNPNYKMVSKLIFKKISK